MCICLWYHCTHESVTVSIVRPLFFVGRSLISHTDRTLMRSSRPVYALLESLLWKRLGSRVSWIAQGGCGVRIYLIGEDECRKSNLID